MGVKGNLPPNDNINSTTEYFNNYFADRFTTSPNINDAVVGYFQSVTGDAEVGKILASTVIYTALSNGLNPISLVEEFRKLKSGKKVEVKTPMAFSSINTSYTTYNQIVAAKNEYSVGQLFYLSSTNTFYRTHYVELPTSQSLLVQTTFANPNFNANTINIQRNAILSGTPLLGEVVVPEPPVYITDNMPFLIANDAPISSSSSVTVTQSYINTTNDDVIEFNIPGDIVNPDDYIIKSYLNEAIQIEVAQNYRRETVIMSVGQNTYNYFYISYTEEQDELTPYLTVLLNTNRVNTSLLGISNSPVINKYITRAILA